MSPDRLSYIDASGPVVARLESLFRGRPPRVIFDIGSCEGEDAVRYARAFPMATVYAAEPLPENLVRIRDNIVSFGMTNIEVVPAAFSDQAGSADLHVSSGRPPDAPQGEDWDYGNKSSSLLPPDQHLQTYPWISFPRIETVATVTLATFCTNIGIPEIDFIHLDVQGAELRVLRGAGDWLKRTRAIWLEVEAVPLYAGQPLRLEVETFMASHGFTKLVDTVGQVSGDQLYVRRGQVHLSARETITSTSAYRRARPIVRSVRRRLGPLSRPARAWIKRARSVVARRRARRKERGQIAAWTAAGRPVPPPAAVKHAAVAAYADRFGCTCLIQTGTYKGGMIKAQGRRFRRIFSIELDDRLFEQAVDRFRGDRHIEILHGDSGQVLPELLGSVREPCLFWLDGHFSGGITARGALETPVTAELEAILRHETVGHVVLIDDARAFGEGDYPSIEALSLQVAASRPGWVFEVRDDIIRIHAPAPTGG